jgi:hypothetical protein
MGGITNEGVAKRGADGQASTGTSVTIFVAPYKQQPNDFCTTPTFSWRTSSVFRAFFTKVSVDLHVSCE